MHGGPLLEGESHQITLPLVRHRITPPAPQVMAFCTTPLIVGTSLFLICSYMPLHHISVQILFPICAVLSLLFLWATATSDPGVLRRYRTREALPERAKKAVRSSETLPPPPLARVSG